MPCQHLLEALAVRSGAVVVVLAVVALLLATGPAGAGTVVVAVGDHLDIALDINGSGDYDVRYFVAVSDGPAIDVFMMNQDFYDAYLEEESFDYFVDYSTLDTRSVDRTFVWDDKGTFHIVIDNTVSGTPPPVDPELGNATVVYAVLWSPVEDADWPVLWSFLLIGAVLAGLAAVAVRYIMKRPR